VKKLKEEGVLDITALVDPDALPDQSIVIVGVRLKDMDLVKKGEEFSKLRGVTSVCVVTGRFDLILTVLLTKEFPMVKFYTEEVSKLENVRAVETFVVYKSFNLKVPVTLP
jgi:Lrp/AsnC family transcriptional regulator for asnA, asnC and gidA